MTSTRRCAPHRPAIRCARSCSARWRPAADGLAQRRGGGSRGRSARYRATAGDARTEALALIVLATRRVRRGDLAAELPRLAEAEEAAVRLGAHGVRLQAVFAQASVLVAFGEYERAAERARHGIAVAESIGLARTHGAVGSSHLANALIGQGRWDEATAALEHASIRHPPRRRRSPLSASAPQSRWPGVTRY